MKDSFGMIDKFCRHAFEIEDGYGCPDANPRNFKVFRDGFFAGYHMGPGVLEDALRADNVNLLAALDAAQSNSRYLSESLQATRELLAKLELRT